MSKYRICPICGAHLDPGERCDCLEARPVFSVSGPIREKAYAVAAPYAPRMRAQAPECRDKPELIRRCLTCDREACNGMCIHTPEGLSQWKQDHKGEPLPAMA